MHALTSHALPKVSTDSTWAGKWAKDTQTCQKIHNNTSGCTERCRGHLAKLSPLKKHKCRLLEMCWYRSEKLLKVKYSFFFFFIFLPFSLLSHFFPRLIALSHMVQHEMKVLSYMFKVALSISLLSFISDSQSLLIGESFLCCKMEYFFVSTPTISKSNNVLKSYFLLGASLIKLILGRKK